MNLYVLDSDVLSLLQAGNRELAERVAKCSPGETAVTIITVEEQLRGWFSQVRRAKNPQQLARAYDRLARSVSYLSKQTILAFDENAIQRFQTLKSLKLGVSTNDLRIAAIALEYVATLITRNVRDFAVIPGLKTENWTKS